LHAVSSAAEAIEPPLPASVLVNDVVCRRQSKPNAYSPRRSAASMSTTWRSGLKR